MASVFLFGAGASFGSGACAPTNPPLGRDLFARLQELGGVAARVPPELASAFRDRPEAAMAKFGESHYVDLPSLLRQMACFCSKFEPLHGNLYAQLVDVLASRYRHTTLATLNYDLLIERAVCMRGYLVNYELRSLDNNFRVLKLHGSCHFLPQATISGLTLDVRSAPESSMVEAQIRLAESHEEVVEYCERKEREESPLHPAMALYAEGKPVFMCAQLVRQQQAAWSQLVKNASRIFVVGVAVAPQDKHIWQVLAEARAPVYFAEPSPEKLREWISQERRGSKKSYVLETDFQNFVSRLPGLLN